MSEIIDYNNSSLYKFNNNLEVEIPINYISFYKIRDIMFSPSIEIRRYSQINYSVFRKVMMIMYQM